MSLGEPVEKPRETSGASDRPAVEPAKTPETVENKLLQLARMERDARFEKYKRAVGKKLPDAKGVYIKYEIGKNREDGKYYFCAGYTAKDWWTKIHTDAIFDENGNDMTGKALDINDFNLPPANLIMADLSEGHIPDRPGFLDRIETEFENPENYALLEKRFIETLNGGIWSWNLHAMARIVLANPDQDVIDALVKLHNFDTYDTQNSFYDAVQYAADNPVLKKLVLDDISSSSSELAGHAMAVARYCRWPEAVPKIIARLEASFAKKRADKKTRNLRSLNSGLQYETVAALIAIGDTSSTNFLKTHLRDFYLMLRPLVISAINLSPEGFHKKEIEEFERTLRNPSAAPEEKDLAAMVLVSTLTYASASPDLVLKLVQQPYVKSWLTEDVTKVLEQPSFWQTSQTLWTEKLPRILSLAIVVKRLLDNRNQSVTNENVRNAAANLIAMQQNFEQREIFGPNQNTVILTADKDSTFQFANEEYENIARQSGASAEKIASFKGGKRKNEFLKTLENAPPDTTVVYYGHGWPDHLALNDGVKITADEFCGALEKNPNIGKVTILLECCFSNDFARALLQRFDRAGKEKPSIITVAPKDRPSTFGLASVLGKTAESKHGQPITGKDFFNAEAKLVTQSIEGQPTHDIGIFAGEETGTEIAQFLLPQSNQKAA